MLCVGVCGVYVEMGCVAVLVGVVYLGFLLISHSPFFHSSQFKNSTLTPRIFSSDSKNDKGLSIAGHVGSNIYVKKKHYRLPVKRNASGVI